MTDCVNPPADRRAITLAAVLGLGLLMLPAGAARAGELNLTETGSSLLYPLFNVWVAEYTKTHPGIRITTGSTGSGAGIDQAVSGAVQIGASDAYMSDAQARKSPRIINVPMRMVLGLPVPTISALSVMFAAPFSATVAVLFRRRALRLRARSPSPRAQHRWSRRRARGALGP